MTGDVCMFCRLTSIETRQVFSSLSRQSRIILVLRRFVKSANLKRHDREDTQINLSQ